MIPPDERAHRTWSLSATIATIAAVFAASAVFIALTRTTPERPPAAAQPSAQATVTATVTRSVTRPVRTTVTRTVTKTLSVAPAPTQTTESVVLDCKVESFGADNLQFEVSPGVAAYQGSARVTLIEQTRGIQFPDQPIVTVHPFGSLLNWHPVPADDRGASAGPDTCNAVPTS